MKTLSRSLSVSGDGAPVTGFTHAYLTGKESLSLLPSLFTLRLWNLSDSDYLLLSRCRSVTVTHDSAILAWGTLADCYRKLTKDGTVTELCISPALPLWESTVSLSVEAGTTVSGTVRAILAASGTGIFLLSFPGEDPAISRPQAFYGRASECIMDVLSAVNARAYLVPAGLCVVPSSGLPVTLNLTDEDLLKEPSFAADSRMILQTSVSGWTVGKTASVTWPGGRAKGLIVSRAVDADNQSGPWKTELLIEVSIRD